MLLLSRKPKIDKFLVFFKINKKSPEEQFCWLWGQLCMKQNKQKLTSNANCLFYNPRFCHKGLLCVTLLQPLFLNAPLLPVILSPLCPLPRTMLDNYVKLDTTKGDNAKIIWIWNNILILKTGNRHTHWFHWTYHIPVSVHVS